MGEKLEGYGLEKVQYVHIQFRWGAEGGLFIGAEVRWECNLKCNVIFGEDFRNPACY